MRVRLALFGLLFALPVLLLAFLQFERDSHRIHNTAKADVDGAAQALVRRLGQDLSGAEAVARAIAGMDLGRAGAAAACSLALRRAVAAAGARITNYAIATPDGEVVCSGRPLSQPVNVAALPHVRQALATQRAVLSGFAVGRVSGEGSLQLVVPILDSGGNRVVALGVAGLTAAKLVTQPEEDGALPLTLTLLDRNGFVASRSPATSAVSPGQNVAASDLFRRRNDMTGAAMELAGLDGVARLYTSRPVVYQGETVLWVLSGVDVRALRAATLAGGARDLAIVLLLAAAVAALALFATRTLSREIARREASESEFRTLAESMPHIVWMSRPDGRNIYFNQRWSDYTGMTLAQSSGYGWNKPFHPDDMQPAHAAWKRAVATQETYMFECRLRRADGVYRWWLLRGEPQRDTLGNVAKCVGTCTDIHDMKLAELEISRANRELKQQQMELRVLFDLMPAVILFKDTENRILRINRLGAQAAGRTVEEIEGHSAMEIFPATGAEGHLADLEVIRSGRPQLGKVQHIRNRQGEYRWLQRDRVPYRDVSGKVIGIVLMAQDITERKRDQDTLRELNASLESRVRQRTEELSVARLQAEEASKAKSDFLAAVSHEIRTPMSGLLGLLELLQLGTLDDDQHSTLALARDSGSALLSMIDDILDFSKIEANRLELNLAATSVKEIVENCCRLHSQIASRKNLLLHFEVAHDISPLLSVDPLRLGQILNNFLNNAIKFTDHGSVEVKVELAGRELEAELVRFVVRDTGIGMSKEQLARLFQPFVQAEAATTGRFGGTGLGLVIARRLAELMGGTVEIESNPGNGTTLTLQLSLEVCDAAASVQPAVRSRREALDALVMGRRTAPCIADAEAEGTLLLVVDDHPTNRVVLVRQLASLGYAAEVAIDGAQALALWKRRNFAAVITDCNMPLLNGYELATHIRAIEQSRGQHRIPIIACTANALQSAKDLCMGAGMDDCLVKPADLAKVCEMLDRWLPLARAEPEVGQGVSPHAAIAQRPATAAEGLLDMVLLGEISGGSAAVQAQILLDFRHANELDARGLRQAAGKEEFAPVMEFSHRIKGASLMLGATLLSRVCGRIETAGAASDPADLRVEMGNFEAELLRLNNFLDAIPEIAMPCA